MAEDLTTVRLLAADTGDPVLSDDQYTALLTLYGGDDRRAAARALRIMAASETLVSKVIRTQDLQTNGAAVSAELRALADTLDREADAADVVDDGGFFEVIGGEPARPEATEYPW